MKNNIKKIIKVVIFLLLIAAVYGVLSLMFVSSTKSVSRTTLHDYYETSENNDITNLIIGPSHAFLGINAQTLTDDTGEQWYNLSTSLQNTMGSYYLLKEADKDNDLQNVYLEISADAMCRGMFDSMTDHYLILDYMKWDSEKLAYIKEIPSEYRLDTLSPLIRTVDRLKSPLDWSNGVANMFKKLGSDYRNAKFIEGSGGYYYLGRGSFTGKYDAETGTNNFALNTNAIVTELDITATPDRFDKEQLEYLDKIVDYCKANNIHLTLFETPLTDLNLAADTERYDNIINYFSSYASEKGIDYLDFNRVERDDALPLDNTDFMNLDHLNDQGNAIFTQCFEKYVTGDFSAYTVAPSVTDRMSDDTDRFYGVMYTLNLSDTADDDITAAVSDSTLSTSASEASDEASDDAGDSEYQLYVTPVTSSDLNDEKYDWDIRVLGLYDNDDVSGSITAGSIYNDQAVTLYETEVSGTRELNINLPAKYEGLTLSVQTTDSEGNVVNYFEVPFTETVVE